jgi:hypothetical protein
VVTQAVVSRAVRGAIKAHREAGLEVGAVTTEVTAESVRVQVSTPAESQQPPRSNVERLADDYRKGIRRVAAGPA